MRMFRTVVMLAVLVIVASITKPADAAAATLSLVGSNTKVCQLIGDTDWATGQPTAAQTLTKFGLDAVDLGFPVDTGAGQMFLLFGDALPNTAPPGSTPTVPPNDALGWTTRTAVPDDKTCLDLQIATTEPKTFTHPTVTPAIKQGAFNVPSGGALVDDKLYAFFWTNHCAEPVNLKPNTTAPLAIPPPSEGCAETAEVNSVGQSVLAQATVASPTAFTWTTPQNQSAPNMPSGFVYASAVNTPPQVATGRPGIPVFGVPRYRASVPYLAVAPRATFGDPQTWSFYAGIIGDKSIWVTRRQWESGRNAGGQWVPPDDAEIYQPVRTSERCVGEHSVTWNAPLQAWLLLYNCPGTGIEARFATDLWGPWSAPVVMLSPAKDPTIACTLIMNAAGCPGLKRRSYWTLPDGQPRPGGLYAPFIMTRFTKDATPAGAGRPKRTTIYWLLSTWNPYVVVVMQSTLELNP